MFREAQNLLHFLLLFFYQFFYVLRCLSMEYLWFLFGHHVCTIKWKVSLLSTTSLYAHCKVKVGHGRFNVEKINIENSVIF